MKIQKVGKWDLSIYYLGVNIKHWIYFEQQGMHTRIKQNQAIFF